ncbi:hypothetical protein [Paenibacillus sp. NPDC058071]|uniref:hypothetical protein n=1 Tax=Paenibacillus sp. NPDC058071 TaxID=3346326 RepID=UPI0036DE29E9
MNLTCENFRYEERGWPRRDLTFKFYSNGALTILDNRSEEVIQPNDLKGDSLDFYIRRRIAFIKKQLSDSQLRYA